MRSIALSVLRRALRWLESPGQASATLYMRSSRARDLREIIRPDLDFADIETVHARMAVDGMEVLWLAIEASFEKLKQPSQ